MSRNPNSKVNPSKETADDAQGNAVRRSGAIDAATSSGSATDYTEDFDVRENAKRLIARGRGVDSSDVHPS